MLGRSAAEGLDLPNVLTPFLRPSAVALIGASRDENAVTARPARYLREYRYPGEVYIVNPGASEDGEELYGFPVVASIGDVASPCQTALIMVPADQQLLALEHCAEAGVMNAISIASGFEGLAGAELRADLHAFLAAVPEFRLIGPNCAGVMSAIGNVVLGFSSVLLQETLTAGRVGLVMQSGAIGNGLLLALLRRGAGIAHWVTTGNEADLGSIQVASTMLEDPECAGVGLFLEGITDAEWLGSLATEISRTGKPVVALRSGASPLGRVAAFGHTGRIIGNDEIARAALSQAGVRLVDTLEELCDALTVLSVMVPTHFDGTAKVGVVTVSGGTGVIAADAVARSDRLELTDLAAARSLIENEVSGPTAVANPYDVPVLGDPALFARAILAMGRHGGCDVVLAIVSTLAHDYDMLSRIDYADLPPIVFSHLSPDERFTPAQARRLSAWGIPTVPSPQNAIRAIADWAGPPSEDHGNKRADELQYPSRRWGLVRSRDVVGNALSQWLPTTRVALSLDEAVLIASEVTGPLVVKAEGSLVEHRSELGAVKTDLGTPEAVVAAYMAVAQICAEYGEDVVIQATAPPGLEVLVSIVRDPEVGIAAVCRPGGILAELGLRTLVLTGDPSLWPAILSRSVLGQLLFGYRGGPTLAADGFLEVVKALIEVARSNDRILGIECNPVIVHEVSFEGQPATIVDLLVHTDDPLA